VREGIVVGTLTRRSIEGVKFGIKATALQLLRQIGVTNLDSKRENKPMIAQSALRCILKYVVLVNAKGD